MKGALVRGKGPLGWGSHGLLGPLRADPPAGGLGPRLSSE